MSINVCCFILTTHKVISTNRRLSHAWMNTRRGTSGMQNELNLTGNEIYKIKTVKSCNRVVAQWHTSTHNRSLRPEFKHATMKIVSAGNWPALNLILASKCGTPATKAKVHELSIIKITRASVKRIVVQTCRWSSYTKTAPCTYIHALCRSAFPKREIAGSHVHIINTYRCFTVRGVKLLRTPWGPRIVPIKFLPYVQQKRGNPSLTANSLRIRVLTNNGRMHHANGLSRVERPNSVQYEKGENCL